MAVPAGIATTREMAAASCHGSRTFCTHWLASIPRAVGCLGPGTRIGRCGCGQPVLAIPGLISAYWKFG